MKPIVQSFETSLTPFELFLRVTHLPCAIFLDSANAPADMAHYSFIAADPFLRVQSVDGRTRVDSNPESGNPFEVLRRHWRQFPLESVSDLPSFQGGVAGYFSYDLGRCLETLPDPPIDELGLSDLDVGFYDCVLAIDHQSGEHYLISSGYPAQTISERLSRAEARLNQFASFLSSPHPNYDFGGFPPLPEPQSSFEYPEYIAAIRQTKEYIAAGDIYQANITQQFQAPFSGDPLGFYQTLRRTNPAAFAACLKFDDTVVASVSPERFLRCEDGAVETRPIKGTRPRGSTPSEDEALALELSASEKDRAENVMIVDLMRNDLSRVCRLNSVKVPSLFAVESHPTVWHLVSTVMGQLDEDKDPIDLLKATFPGGSITGAPKIRAMEIITELEQRKRGVYCGSIGYLSFDGTLDTSIAIRTAVIKDGVLTFHGGGGIVADSDPHLEYEESLVKVKSFFRVVQRGGLSSENVVEQA